MKGDRNREQVSRPLPVREKAAASVTPRAAGRRGRDRGQRLYRHEGNVRRGWQDPVRWYLLRCSAVIPLTITVRLVEVPREGDGDRSSSMGWFPRNDHECPVSRRRLVRPDYSLLNHYRAPTTRRLSDHPSGNSVRTRIHYEHRDIRYPAPPTVAVFH